MEDYGIIERFLNNLSLQINAPQLLTRKELSQTIDFLDPKYKYGVLYFDGQFNDSKLVLETILTSTALNLDSETDIGKGKVII